MLKLEISKGEYFNSSTGEFIYIKPQTITLEHSLVSISKWESKFKKPFLTKEEKTREETLAYIECMTLTQNVDPNVFKYMTIDNIRKIQNYMDDPMTATTFNDKQSKKNRDIITSEIIYYWMIELGIPTEYQKWHLNRLLTLIKVCNIKRSPSKKMSKKEIMNQNRSLNAARRAAANSKG